MTPRMPKISVRPLATRKSSSPYCTALRHWTRNTAKSMEGPGRDGASFAPGMMLRRLRERERRLHRRLAADPWGPSNQAFGVRAIGRRRQTARRDVGRLVADPKGLIALKPTDVAAMPRRADERVAD